MLTERIYICTNAARVGLLRAIVQPYLVEEEGPTEHDPNYLLTVDVPMLEWNNIKQVILGTN